MEKCEQCNFKTIKEKPIRNPNNDKVVETSSVCSNCGHVQRKTKH